MPIIDELGINTQDLVEIIDFIHDAKFSPKNQQKYFFDDAMSYYQQLCKITKLLTEFQGAFEIVYQNELNLANNMVTEDGLDEAISNVTEEFSEAVSELDEAIDVINGELPDKLEDVSITGEGVTVVSQSIVDGTKNIELSISSSAGGTVTSVEAGTGLTGGTITTSGTIAIDTDTVALKSDLPDMDDYVAKADATGYDDILTQTSASSTYVAKADATGYDDILTQTSASSTYVAKADATGYGDILTQTSASSTYVAKADATGYGDILTQTSASSTYVAKADATGYNDILTQTSAQSTYAPKSIVRSNISISVAPTSMGSYQPWDSAQNYGYSASITVSGITANSLIKNIVVGDTILEAIAPYITTGTNSLTIYTKDATSLTGTIYTLVTEEV